MQSAPSTHLYNLQFLLLCASIFFFSAGFQMLISELIDFLTALDGAFIKDKSLHYLL
jgi:hypothetical protein